MRAFPQGGTARAAIRVVIICKGLLAPSLCGIVDLQKSAPQKASRHMALTGKQVRQLRALAHHLNPVVLIGKADVTDAIAKQADEALEARELIKCGVQDGSLLSCREAAEQLAERVGAEIVQVIGHRFALYRASGRKDIERIKLD